MSSLITLSSAKAKELDPTINPSNFVTNFFPPLEIGGINNEVAVAKIDTWYTYHNLTGAVMTWSSDNGVTPHSITIPDGNYTTEDLNALLADDQLAKGVTDVDGVTGQILYGIILFSNYNTNKAVVAIDSTILAGAYTFTFDLSGPNAPADFLGFTPANITATVASDLIPNVNAGVDQLQIRTDLVRNSYDGGVASDVMYGFVPQVPPAAHITIEPLHLIYLQVSKKTIDSIRLKLTDQNGRLIDLQGEDVTVQLHLRPLRSAG